MPPEAITGIGRGRLSHRRTLFTRVTLLWSSGAAPGDDVGFVLWACRRGTGAARDQHAVDLPGYVAL